MGSQQQLVLFCGQGLLLVTIRVRVDEPEIGQDMGTVVAGAGIIAQGAGSDAQPPLPVGSSASAGVTPSASSRPALRQQTPVQWGAG
ncbi:MAG TPA: hypothetical protein DF427_02735 [Moraxellaceae bacterium]|nr:hypothetical protein [Moraxellaceae bacterium]